MYSTLPCSRTYYVSQRLLELIRYIKYAVRAVQCDIRSICAVVTRVQSETIKPGNGCVCKLFPAYNTRAHNALFSG